MDLATKLDCCGFLQCGADVPVRAFLSASNATSAMFVRGPGGLRSLAAEFRNRPAFSVAPRDWRPPGDSTGNGLNNVARTSPPALSYRPAMAIPAMFVRGPGGLAVPRSRIP